MYDQIHYAVPWAGVNHSSNFCNGELCHVCASGFLASVPWGPSGYQYPRTGDALAHIKCFFDGTYTEVHQHDYLIGKLSSPLVANESYCVSFYVNLADESGWTIESIGAYFDDGSINNSDSCGYPLTQFIPQVVNNSGVFMDTLNWVKVEGSFVANGTEEYITIGNFQDPVNSNPILTYFSGDNFGKYNIDDVCVVKTDLDAYAGPDTWVVEGDSVFIGRNEIVPGCTWFVNGSVVDSGAGIWVHPTTTTTYVVEQTICGLTKTDTVKVDVWPVSINGITNGQQVGIYPNPATNQLFVKQGNLVFTQAVIYNQLGQLVSKHLLNDKETKLDITDLPVGVYQISLESDRGKEVRRFVKM